MCGRAVCDVLCRAPMNAITFGTKRAFHGFLKVTRKALAEFGLTAARFDMLSALLVENPDPLRSSATLQSDLRRMLGVSAPVVTRMLKSLEVLGLVVRQRPLWGDKRQKRVWLTEAGERCIRMARKVMLRAMRKLVLVAICFGRHRDRDARFRHMEKLEGYLRSLRERFGDRASLYYAWGHPDD